MCASLELDYIERKKEFKRLKKLHDSYFGVSWVGKKLFLRTEVRFCFAFELSREVYLGVSLRWEGNRCCHLLLWGGMFYDTYLDPFKAIPIKRTLTGLSLEYVSRTVSWDSRSNATYFPNASSLLPVSEPGDSKAFSIELPIALSRIEPILKTITPGNGAAGP